MIRLLLSRLELRETRGWRRFASALIPCKFIKRRRECGVEIFRANWITDSSIPLSMAVLALSQELMKLASGTRGKAKVEARCYIYIYISCGMFLLPLRWKIAIEASNEKQRKEPH